MRDVAGARTDGLTRDRLPVPRPSGEASRDVTAAQRAAREPPGLSAAILASSRDCIVVLDLDGAIRFVSPGGIDAMEIGDVDAVIGTPWLRVWDGQDNAAARAAVTAAREGGSGRFAASCATYRGTPKWWDVLVSPLTGTDGRPEALVTIARDVTDQRRAEGLLRDTEERRRQAVEAADIGTWAFDLPTAAVHWDSRVKALAGLADEAEADWDMYLATLHPDDRDRVVAVARTALDPAGPGTYQTEYRSVGLRDGAERWVSVTGRTHFEGGRPVRVVGTAIDVTARRRAEERAKLLGGELQHRIKNTLSMVQAMVRQTLRGAASLADAQSALDLRINALARANDTLIRQDWTGSDLREAASAALVPHDDGTPGRFRLSGPAVWLPAEAAMSLALVLNELATNATKYGALSVAGGHVELDWTADAVPSVAAQTNLTLVWREHAGPAVREPAHKGFGSKLIETGLAGGLGGSATLRFLPEGVTCTVQTVLSGGAAA